MARRGSILVHALALAAVVILEAGAFTVWNVGTRSPAALARDVIGGFSSGGIRTRGLVLFLAGTLLIAAAQTLLLAAERGRETTVVNLVLEGWTVCAALLVEMLVGSLIRAR